MATPPQTNVPTTPFLKKHVHKMVMQIWCATYLTTLALFLFPVTHAFLPLRRESWRIICPPNRNDLWHPIFSLPASKIDCDTNGDQALLDAIANMALLTDAHRVFHGRGGTFPGCEHLTLDWFSPVWVLTSFKVVSEEDLNRWHDALSKRWKEISPNNDEEALTWVYQCRTTSPPTTQLMSGEVPNPHIVTENGNQYIVHVMRGQNHGLFLDMAYGRAWVQQHSRNNKVLNLFSYTCSFSISALAGGAKEVVNVDMSKGALKIGQKNHELNDSTNGARFLGHNIFKTWGKIKKLGPYDIIVVDPPSYQKGSFVAEKDYIKLVRRLPTLLSPSGGGYILLCLNAPELDTEFLHAQVVEAAPELQFIKRLDNPPSFPVADSEKALKVLLYQMPLQNE